jgi:uncharacterized protein DUF6187
VSDFDTLFSLPAVDDPPAIEIGVILMGLDAERLVAGLGLASMADDAALVTLAVDHLRHAAPHPFSLEGALTAGVRRWLAARPALAVADPGPPPVAASIRQTWTRTVRTLAVAVIGDAGPATRAYLAACWIRRHDVDGFCQLRAASADSTMGA